MVGLVKQSLYKTIGNANLKWSELEEVIIDIEVALNNRPLSYVEDDIQLPILTPNAIQFGLPNIIPEEEVDEIEDLDVRKRARYLRRCKDVLWTRWTGEYIRGLREKHNLKHKAKSSVIKIGDVVIIKNDERNRGKWNLGIVEELIEGKDKVVRGAKVRTAKSLLERAIQHLYPLELTCDTENLHKHKELNSEAAEFRPKRTAAINATELNRVIAEEDDEEL
eukprot:gene14442-biopygen11541